MVIVNGSVASADEVMNAMGSLFKDTANSIWNAAYIGWDSKLYAGAGTPNLKNVAYDIFASDNQTKVGGVYNSTNDYYEFIEVDDEINNSDLTDHWTATVVVPSFGSASASEDTEKLRLSISDPSGTGTGGSVKVESDGGVGTPIDYYNSNKDSHIRTRVAISGSATITGGGSASLNAQWGLTDGSNTVYLKTLSDSGATVSISDDSIWDIYIDASADTATIYDDGVLDTADIDISSLTGGNYYFVAFTDSGAGGGTGGTATTTVDLYYLYSRKVDSTISITSPTAEVSSSTVTNAILCANSGTGPQLQLSADNGSNYENVTDSTIHRFTNTGTQIFVRATDAVASITVPETIPKYSEYAVKYNLY